MATWLDWCIKAPGPPEKAGYAAQSSRALSEILYIVNHSAEGWKSFLVQGHRPGANASWSFSNNQDGSMYQHYPLEAITYTSGGFRQNVDGLGVEHEGVAGQLLNAVQIANDKRLYGDVAELCPNLRAARFMDGYREHNELTNGATTCPSGRIQSLYDAYETGEEGDVAITEAEFRRIREDTWSVMLELLRLGTTGDKNTPMKQWSDKVLSGLADLKSKLDSHDHH